MRDIKLYEIHSNPIENVQRYILHSLTISKQLSDVDEIIKVIVSLCRVDIGYPGYLDKQFQESVCKYEYC